MNSLDLKFSLPNLGQLMPSPSPSLQLRDLLSTNHGFHQIEPIHSSFYLIPMGFVSNFSRISTFPSTSSSSLIRRVKPLYPPFSADHSRRNPPEYNFRPKYRSGYPQHRHTNPRIRKNISTLQKPTINNSFIEKIAKVIRRIFSKLVQILFFWKKSTTLEKGITFKKLPDDLVQQVFGFLDLSSRENCKKATQRFQRILDNDKSRINVLHQLRALCALPLEDALELESWPSAIESVFLKDSPEDEIKDLLGEYLSRRLEREFEINGSTEAMKYFRELRPEHRHLISRVDTFFLRLSFDNLKETLLNCPFLKHFAFHRCSHFSLIEKNSILQSVTRQLKTVDISIDITDKILGDFLKKQDQLEELSLEHLLINGSSLSQVSEDIFLKRVHLKKCNYLTEQNLTEFLEKLSHLERLYLTSTDKSLRNAIPKNPPFEVLPDGFFDFIPSYPSLFTNTSVLHRIEPPHFSKSEYRDILTEELTTATLISYSPPRSLFTHQERDLFSGLSTMPSVQSLEHLEPSLASREIVPLQLQNPRSDFLLKMTPLSSIESSTLRVDNYSISLFRTSRDEHHSRAILETTFQVLQPKNKYHDYITETDRKIMRLTTGSPQRAVRLTLEDIFSSSAHRRLAEFSDIGTLFPPFLKEKESLLGTLTSFLIQLSLFQ